jgi:hypothetical protein
MSARQNLRCPAVIEAEKAGGVNAHEMGSGVFIGSDPLPGGLWDKFWKRESLVPA